MYRPPTPLFFYPIKVTSYFKIECMQQCKCIFATLYSLRHAKYEISSVFTPNTKTPYLRRRRRRDVELGEVVLRHERELVHGRRAQDARPGAAAPLAVGHDARLGVPPLTVRLINHLSGGVEI